jgi:hypothetical protein
MKPRARTRKTGRHPHLEAIKEVVYEMETKKEIKKLKILVIVLMVSTGAFGTTTVIGLSGFFVMAGITRGYQSQMAEWLDIFTIDTHFYQTIEFNTSFDLIEQTMRLKIPYVGYFLYKLYRPHTVPTSASGWLSYCTPNDVSIKNIAELINESCVLGEEDVADSVLNFVQDKGNFTACLHYISEGQEYPKYPIETLTEGGGDCDDHAILYASLMKALGFQVALIVSYEAGHMWCGVHLSSAPAFNSQGPTYWYVDYQSVRYYMAETTSWGWRVGDLPPGLQGVTIYVCPL